MITATETETKARASSSYTYNTIEAKLKRINYDSKQIIEDFILPRLEANPLWGIYHYSYNYYYNQLSGKQKNYYCIFEYNGDKILTVIHKVFHMRTAYNRLMGFPYSLANNVDNERVIFDVLFDEYIEQAYISGVAIDRVDLAKYKKEEIVDEDYYINLSNREILDNKKYIKGQKVNHFLSDSDFSFRKIELKDKEGIMALYKAWGSHRPEKEPGKLSYQKYLDGFNQLTIYDKLLQYGMFYKDTIIALSTFTPTIEGYCWGNMQWEYRTYDKIVMGNPQLSRIVSRSGKILHYLCLVELHKLGMKFMSCSGAVKEEGLAQHKRETFPHKIEYWLVKSD